MECEINEMKCVALKIIRNGIYVPAIPDVKNISSSSIGATNFGGFWPAKNM